MSRFSNRRRQNNKGGSSAYSGNMESFPRVEVSSIPDIPLVETQSVQAPSVKAATPDLIIFDNDIVPPDVMANLTFEKIGGQELITVSRNDIVNGQNVVYQPVKNISQIALRYNPQNLVQLQNPSSVLFENFPINFAKCIPTLGTGPNGEIVYVEAGTGNIIINTVNLARNEQIEVQVFAAGSVLDGTIYVEDES